MMQQIPPKIQDHITKRTLEITREYIQRIKDLFALYGIDSNDISSLPEVVKTVMETDSILSSPSLVKATSRVLEVFKVNNIDPEDFLRFMEGRSNER